MINAKVNVTQIIEIYYFETRSTLAWSV